MHKHILIPTDGSETALKAVQAGIDFARESGARARTRGVAFESDHAMADQPYLR